MERSHTEPKFCSAALKAVVKPLMTVAGQVAPAFWQVAALQHGRNGLHLHQGGRGPAGSFGRLGQTGAQAQGGEAGHGDGGDG